MSAHVPARSPTTSGFEASAARHSPCVGDLIGVTCPACGGHFHIPHYVYLDTLLVSPLLPLRRAKLQPRSRLLVLHAKPRMTSDASSSELSVFPMAVPVDCPRCGAPNAATGIDAICLTCFDELVAKRAVRCSPA